MRRRRSTLLLLVPLLVAGGLALGGRSWAPELPGSEDRSVSDGTGGRGGGPGGRRGGTPEGGAAGERVARGAVQVVDGDTVRIGRERIRLHGIDAPERAQSCADAEGRRYDCGREATAALRRLIGDGAPDCAERDRDSYGRSVAVCTLGGRDLNRAMVAQGWAVAYTRYSRDYAGDEAAARRARRGLWRGSFERPDVYRQERRRRS